MYEYITGKLTEKSPTHIVLDVQGVGYRIHIPVSTYAALPSTTEIVKVLTHLVIKEDDHVLYGFYTEEERDLFRLLISVSGIGPKIAMTALSGIPIAEFKRALVDGSLHVLTSISGIGRKIAERMVVELREKVVLSEKQTGAKAAQAGTQESPVMEDSISALVELGYRRANAKEAVQKVLKDEGQALPLSELIRKALQYI